MKKLFCILSVSLLLSCSVYKSILGETVTTTYSNGYVLDISGKTVATYGNGYVLDVSGETVATYSNGYISKSKE